MKKFKRSELDRFNNRLQNVLENKKCVGVFEQYLNKLDRSDLKNTFNLWSEAQKAKLRRTGVSEEMFNLMEEINDFNVVENGNLEDIMNQCCHLLEDLIKVDFMIHLKKYHYTD